MPRHKPYKTEFQIGMETILNNKQASFLTNPDIFSEVQKQSGMSITQMVRHLGKNKRSGPTEKEKSEQRLNNLESKVNGNN